MRGRLAARRLTLTRHFEATPGECVEHRHLGLHHDDLTNRVEPLDLSNLWPNDDLAEHA
jgi:hypothetical protein